MKYARGKLIGYGILIVAVGVLIEISATNLVSFLANSAGQPNQVLSFLVDFFVSILRFGIAPLGAAMVAIGIALHLINKGKKTETGNPDQVE
ncbi:hypothetical protein [Psychromicrobium sp. YIM B11713]|uniref:hypothetical protein n=1 Tax=Psychromicrobium sp. YIM B11713 TaxID=3145233 RepID=UPI00374FC455